MINMSIADARSTQREGGLLRLFLKRDVDDCGTRAGLEYGD